MHSAAGFLIRIVSLLTCALREEGAGPKPAPSEPSAHVLVAASHVPRAFVQSVYFQEHSILLRVESGGAGRERLKAIPL